MSFNHPAAFLFLCGILILFTFERLWRLRRIIFLLASLAFVVLFYSAASGDAKANPGWLAFLTAFVAVHYLVVQAMLRIRAAGIRSLVYYAWFLGMIATFLTVKQYTWLTSWMLPGAEESLHRLNSLLSLGNAGLPVVTIGLSFLIFRQVHMAIEVRDGVLKACDVLDYLSYMVAFWTFCAGPIQRFEPFQTEFQRLASPGHGAAAADVLLGLNRVMFGYLKMFVVGDWFAKMATPQTFTRHPDAAHLALFLLAYPLFMYLNFTGYCDIVIGFARSVGFELPENFNRPLLARNMVDYWNRWHMTLSQFFRDYMYLPIYTALRKRTPRTLAMAVTSLLSFLVMGIWHGPTAMMAVFGLFHGVGVVLVNLYAELLKKLLTREQLKHYSQSLTIRVIAVIFCQAYVVAAFLFFAYDWNQLTEVCRCAIYRLR
jgi:D-alanyl-lipoteichoic acid acyltransferase DltB (MBOAT superfamily)